LIASRAVDPNPEEGQPMITHTTLRLVLATGCAVILGAAATAFAQGETVEIQTEVIIRDTAPAFHGKVKADNENCVEDREVRLYKEKRSGGKKLLGLDQASNSGKWKIPFDKLTSGAYFAIAKKVEQGTAGTIYECVKGKSVVIPVD
jgi:hypothetical protein